MQGAGTSHHRSEHPTIRPPPGADNGVEGTLKIVITGAAGFLGRKLSQALLARQGPLPGFDRPLTEVVGADLVPPPALEDTRFHPAACDIGDAGAVRELVADADLVFHLAAIVSADAEADFDRGMRVNLDGTRHLLEALRHGGRRPRLVFASSVAVYGGDLPATITDTTHLTPQTSYGTQKAAGELLVNDYSRKGFLDGRSLRLPTIVVRAGKPNLAASTFASSIIREPLAGQEAVCPVTPETSMYLLSPRRVIEAFQHAAGLPAEAFGKWRSVVLPGLTVSIGEMVETLRRVAGAEVAARVRFAPDPRIQAIVDTWPARFAPERGLAMGFAVDADFEEIVRAHIEDELGGRISG